MKNLFSCGWSETKKSDVREVLLDTEASAYGSNDDVVVSFDESDLSLSVPHRLKEKHLHELLTLLEQQTSTQLYQLSQSAAIQPRVRYSNLGLNVQYSIGALYWLLFESLLVIASGSMIDGIPVVLFDGSCKAFHYPSPLLTSLGAAVLFLPALIYLNYRYWNYIESMCQNDNLPQTAFNVQFFSCVYGDTMRSYNYINERITYYAFVCMVIFPEILRAILGCALKNEKGGFVQVLTDVGNGIKAVEFLMILGAHYNTMSHAVSWLASYSLFQHGISQDLFYWESAQEVNRLSFTERCPLYDLWPNAGFLADCLNAENAVLVNEDGIHTYYLKVNWALWCLLKLQSGQRVCSPVNPDIGAVVSIDDLKKVYPIYTRQCSISLHDVADARDIMVTNLGQIYTATGESGIIRWIRKKEIDPNTQQRLTAEDLKLVRKQQLLKIIDNMVPVTGEQPRSQTHCCVSL